MAENAIEVSDLSVRFGDLTVLQDVYFKVEKGDIVGIVGPNGGGKTTLINAILGNVPIEKGSISLFGTDIKKFRDYQKIGYVSQNAIQFDSIFPATVWEIVSLGCISRSNLGHWLSREDKKAIQHALELVELDTLKDRQINQLSGGQKQRIFIAKALVRRPELLILDEATCGLDVCIQDKFVDIIRKLRKEMEVTVLTVSHDISGVLCQANKLAVVNRRVFFEKVTKDSDPTQIMRDAYGPHFTFVVHHHDHAPITIENPKLNGGERP
jgi:zinc transport system ATP-binding protein